MLDYIKKIPCQVLSSKVRHVDFSMIRYSPKFLSLHSNVYTNLTITAYEPFVPENSHQKMFLLHF